MNEHNGVKMTLRVNNSTELLALCEDYIAKAGIGASRFGWMACNDLSFISKLRHQANYNPRIQTVTKVLDYIEAMTKVDEDVAEGL